MAHGLYEDKGFCQCIQINRCPFNQTMFILYHRFGVDIVNRVDIVDNAVLLHQLYQLQQLFNQHLQ